MKVSKNPILELEPYPDEFEWEEFLIRLGHLVKKRFNTGYVQCQAENMGWRHAKGHKVFLCNDTQNEIDTAKDFLYGFAPDCDWCCSVYSLNDGKGLYFSLSNHDAQGERYYLTPVSERTYSRLN